MKIFSLTTKIRRLAKLYISVKLKWVYQVSMEGVERVEGVGGCSWSNVFCNLPLTVQCWAHTSNINHWQALNYTLSYFHILCLSNPLALYLSNPLALYLSNPLALYLSNPLALYLSNPLALYLSIH